MDMIPWEQTADGKGARLTGQPPFLVNSAVALRRLAVAKMVEVARVGASFAGRATVFEPTAEVLIDAGDRVEFMALYGSPLADDEGGRDESVVCARHARWVRDEDFGRLNEAGSRQTHLVGGKQIESRVVFLDAAASAPLRELAEEAASLFRGGLALRAAERPDAAWHQVLARVARDAARFSLSYTPFTSESAELEAWILRWREAFAATDFAGGLVTDNGCRIKYTVSLLELLATINE